jgi:hypothetical protein
VAARAERPARPGWRGALDCTIAAVKRTAFWSFVVAVPMVVVDEIFGDSYWVGDPPLVLAYAAKTLGVTWIYFCLLFPLFGGWLAVKHLAARQRQRKAETGRD